MGNARPGGSQKDGGDRSSTARRVAGPSNAASSSLASGGSTGSAIKNSAIGNARDSHRLPPRRGLDPRSSRRSSWEAPTNKFKTSVPSSGQLSTRTENATPRSSGKQLKGAVVAAHQVPTGKLMFGNNTSTSSLKNSDRTSSFGTTFKKSAKRQMSEHGRTGSVSGPSKKQKRMDARSYRALFKPSSKANSTVVAAPVRVDNGNTSKGHVAGSNVGLACEEGCNALEEQSQRHSSKGANEVSKGSTSGPPETFDMTMEEDVSGTRIDQNTTHFSESHKPTGICSQSNVAEGSLVVKAREQLSCLAGQSCLPATQNRSSFPIYCEEAKKALEENDSIRIQEGSASSQFKVTRSDETYDNEDICLACRTPGILKYCDGKGCKRRYHFSCLYPPLESVSPGIWFCTICTKKRIQFGVYSIAEGIESVWDVKEGMQNGKQYFVKYKSLAHVHNCWVPESDIINDTPGGPELLSKFNKRNHKEQTTRWKKEWTEPHRLLRKRALMPPKEADEFFHSLDDKFSYCNVEWLVKWRGLGYEHATWELETSPFLCTPEAGELKKNYENYLEAAKKSSDPAKTNKVKQSPFQKLQSLPDWCPPGLDNDHLSSINQIRKFWHKSHGAIFVDGQECVIKTILFTMSVSPDICRPLLIVSTSASLSLWEAKFNCFAPSINVVVYNGEKDVRKLIRDLEFYEKDGCIMFQVLLSHPDAILEDIETIECIGWEAVIVDKCRNSRVSKHLEQLKRLSADFRMVLLSSTLKDNLPEYINLLDFLNSGDKDLPIIDLDGDSIETADALVMLKARFVRHVAYERKADSSKFVEYWVPACLSQVQLEIYCSMLLSNSSVLQSYSKINSVGALHDILVSLRKCCDHPYLVDKLLQSSLIKDHPIIETIDIGVHASGKLLLLDRMLKEFRNKGLRVVILFQSGGGKNLMGNILDGIVCDRFGPESYERVERGSLMTRKQAAMNKFNDKINEKFIFLIEIQACLPSIKLSSVDAIVIYGSDWNPLNDLRALQKISIKSKSDHVSIFRLYTPFTVEEMSLLLAKQDMILDNNIQSILPSVSHCLLSWGAPFLFNRLDEFQQDSDTLFMDKVVLEFITRLSTNFEASTEMNSVAISRAHMSGAFYSRNITLVGEMKGISALDGDPQTFWLNLLDGKSPPWHHISEAPPSCGNVQNVEEPAKVPSEESDKARRKRRKFGEIMGSSPKVIPEKNNGIVLPENSTPSISTWQPVDDKRQQRGGANLPGTQKSLHIQLKQELSKLFKVLQLPDNVKCLAERYLEYLMKNHQVIWEPKGILHAFNIALCWRAASVLKCKVDRRESLVLAAKHLNYELNEELAGFVYRKLSILKKKFSCKAGETGNQCQRKTVKSKKSLFLQEASTNFGNGNTIPKQAAFVHGTFINGASQEGPSGAEQIVSEGQELMSVLETCREQHLSRDELLNMITEKRINVVDMVFSLREKKIYDKQRHEISKLDTQGEKEVIRLKEVCSLVLKHIHRSHIDQETRNDKIKLMIKWFTMFIYAFLEHMRCQHNKLEALQSIEWSKERQLKENIQQKSKSGQLDQSFDHTITLPESNFVIEEFIHFKEQNDGYQIDETSMADCQQSMDDSLAIGIPSEAISLEEVRHGPAEALVDFEEGPTSASETVDLPENSIHLSSDGICIQREAPLVAHCSSSSPANDDSINQESSISYDRSTEHVERENIVDSSLSHGGTASHHPGDVRVGLNANYDDTVTADPLQLESPILTASHSLSNLSVSREVQTQTNLSSIPAQQRTSLSAQQSVAPLQHPPTEAEPAVTVGTVAARDLQPEKPPSISMLDVPLERTSPDDRSQIGHQPNTACSAATLPASKEVGTQINPSSMPAQQSTTISAQQSVAPLQHPPTEAEPAGTLSMAVVRDLQSEMQPSTSMLDVPRESDDRSQMGHQPDTAPGPVQRMQLIRVPPINDGSPIMTAPHSPVTLLVSREVETQTNLSSMPAQHSISLSTEQNIALLQDPPAEAEPAGTLGMGAAWDLQPARQPSASILDVPLERTRTANSGQMSHQADTTPGPQSTQLFPVAPIVFNHPPVNDEPLRNELHRLGLYTDSLTKTHEHKKSQLLMECNQEIEKIKRKYDSLLQEEDSAYLWRKKALDDIYKKVYTHQSLAEHFRSQFIGKSTAQGRAPSPPKRPSTQASWQQPARPSAVGATALPVALSVAARPLLTSFPSPVVSPAAARPPVLTSQVVRPSSSSSSSSSAIHSPSIILGNLSRAVSSFVQIPPSHVSYGAGREQARAPAPHLQRYRVPPPYSVVPTNQQQLPARLGVTSRTIWVAPGIPENLKSTSPQMGTPVTSMASCSHAVLPAMSLPSNSHPTLPVTAEVTGLNMVSRSPSGPLDASLRSRHIGAPITGIQQSDSESASLDVQLTANLALSGDPACAAVWRDADGDVVCISDDES